jgi:hypothetical protein
MATQFDESKHARNAAGSSAGGKFRVMGAGLDQQGFEDKVADQPVEYLAIYDKKGKQIGIAKGDERSAAVPPSALRAMSSGKAGVLTHNHPGGRSFSPEDVEIGRFYRLDEVRAVSRTYTYSISPGEKGWPILSTHISDSYDKHNAAVKSIFGPKVSSGSMSVKEANDTHHHEVWVRVSAELGLNYKRTSK